MATLRHATTGIKLLFLLAAALLAGREAAFPQTPRTAPDPGERSAELRVMTYNIHHGAGNEECAPRAAGSAPAADCGLNLERIADVIRSARADIVGLQEVDRFWVRSGGVDQPRALAQLLAMSVCFGPNLQLPNEEGAGGPREYGTAILSRFPLRDCRNEHLPRVADANEQRGLLSADVETPRGTVRVMVTHLSVVAADRVPQTEELAKAAAASRIPTVLMGDLNTRPDAASLRPLLARAKDLWTLAGHGDGLTSAAHPQRPPRSRIDYILATSGITANGIEVVVNGVTRMASDHYPILARIQLTGAR
ncbi:MAG: endonuclease/exonuclease/phosphatase family protein [Bryobacterales bacterium]|nr:endonuclease/exonuclease/phosphatase family protein [Bryobacterales bacterium]